MENVAPGIFVGAGAYGGPKPSILIVDDDACFVKGVRSIFLEHGFGTEQCSSISQAVVALNVGDFQAVVTELVVGRESGIELIKAVASTINSPPVVVLTAYGNISSAVTSVRLGARDFLIKPTEAEDILQSLGLLRAAKHDAERTFKAPQLVRWDYVSKIYEESGRNISATARRLNMHRRTLQRMLARGKP